MILDLNSPRPTAQVDHVHPIPSAAVAGEMLRPSGRRIFLNLLESPVESRTWMEIVDGNPYGGAGLALSVVVLEIPYFLSLLLAQEFLLGLEGKYGVCC